MHDPGHDSDPNPEHDSNPNLGMIFEVILSADQEKEGGHDQRVLFLH